MKLKHLLLAIVATGLISASAFAADSPSRVSPALPPPVFSWTGLYVGGQVGYEWSAESSPHIYSTIGATVGGQPNFNQSGVVGGGDVGYNWQINQVVFGIEGDVEGGNFEGTGNYNGSTYSLHTEIDIQGSVRGRLGYAWDRLLIYGTGGAAFAQLENRYTNSTLGGLDDYKIGRTGWTAGGGFQYAFTPNWSFGLEYRYTDLGHTSNLLLSSSAGTLGANHHEAFNAVRFRANYKLDFFAPAAPLVAKY